MLGSKAVLQPSPLGTVGIIAPWNFPIGMIFYPAASVLAAGNRIMAKPSEFTPNTANLIKEAVGKYFDESEFAVFLGGPEVGSEFTALPLDHLLYTGSGNIAKKVVANAAKNLVPTTLELGGKSPTIIASDANLDYIMVKKGLEEKLIAELKKVFNTFYPENNGADYTSMVNDHHHNRMQEYLFDAKDKGAQIINLGNFDSSEKNTITTKVLLNVNDDMRVMQEEIFGPLLPIMVYENLSEAVSYVNNHDHPLGLYFFGNKKTEQNYVINNTRSGGVTVNDTMFHLMQSRLPFGGVGPSGYGYYHGHEGFLNFSNLRSIYYQTNSDSIFGMLRPPRSKPFELLSKVMKKLS